MLNHLLVKQSIKLLQKRLKATSLRVVSITIVPLLLAGTQPALAQYSDASWSDSNDEIVLYQDCDYQGASRRVRAGDYRDMADINVGNDSVSSIRIPRGMEVKIYEDSRFGGDSYRLTGNVRCLRGDWNDEISSIRVKRVNDWGDDGHYNNNSWNNDGDTVKIYEDCNFHGDVDLLRKGNYKSLGGSDVGNDELSSIRVPKGLQVTIYQHNRFGGRSQTFHKDVSCLDSSWNDETSSIIVSKYRPQKNDNRGRNNNDFSRFFEPSGLIKGHCFNYKAYTNGGAGAVKFHGHDETHRFNDRPYNGRLCHDGALIMEINKADLKTNVFVEIQGKKFRFIKGDKPDRLLNTWYRKKVKLKVVQ